MEEQGTWASRTQKHSEAGYGQPVDRGAWTAKTVKRPQQQPAQPQYANYWAPLTRKRHTMPHPAQLRHTNHWAPRTRKRHQQEHWPQRPTERSNLTQHAKGRTGDCPGPRKETTTSRNVTQGSEGGRYRADPQSRASADDPNLQGQEGRCTGGAHTLVGGFAACTQYVDAAVPHGRVTTIIGLWLSLTTSRERIYLAPGCGQEGGIVQLTAEIRTSNILSTFLILSTAQCTPVIVSYNKNKGNFYDWGLGFKIGET